MIDLGVIRDLVAIFGVIAGFTYYVMTVRNNQKNQDFANESRKAQLFMQLADKISTQEYMDKSQELMEMEWTDFKDFQQKYDSNVNRDNATMRYSHWWDMETIGYLIHEDLIDPEMVYQLGGFQMLIHWYKMEPIIKEYRKVLGNPELCLMYEYLAEVMEEIRNKRGLPPHPMNPNR